MPEAQHPTQQESRSATAPADPAIVAQQRRLEATLFGEPHEPVLVGRFALLRVLGSGAMGVVHLAYDEVLDRKIAIKLIKRHRQADDDAAGLLREAQAMARVSHANVVHVYEAGSYPRGVFVAMELVEGCTLRGWLDAEGAKASWRERLAKVVAAGRGLAEAHRVGVVHRDFKPDNVLVTARGEPKVSDFGLAGMLATNAPARGVASNLATLSCTEGVVGTPLYMAPEVFEGRAADASSDQFGFCVVAYEALYGVRPFEADSFESLCCAVITGKLRPTPSGDVDKEIASAIERGLSVRSEDRWPAMDALLEALSPAPRTRTRPWLVAAIMIATLSVSGAAIWGARSAPPPCGDAAEHLAGVWDPTRRGQLDEAFAASPVAYAGETWRRLAPRVDSYAHAWTEQRTHACGLTRIHHEQSEETLELRRGCLDRARVGISRTVDALAQADAAAVEHGLELVTALPDLRRCEDVATLRESVPSPAADERERVDALWALLSESEVLRASGRYDDALERARQAAQDHEGLEYGAIETEIQLAIGLASVDRQDADTAEEAFDRALELALRHSQWALALDAASWSAFNLGAREHRFAEAHAQLRVARGLLERGGSPHDRAHYESRRGAILDRQGRYDEAILAYRASLAQLNALGDELTVASTRENLGQALLEAGRYDEAEAELRTALDLHRQLRGPRHPKIVHALYSLGQLQTSRGWYDQALETIDQALRLGEEIMPEHPELVFVTVGKSGVLAKQGRFDQTIALLEDAQERWQPILGADHDAVIAIHSNLGAVLLDSGRLEEGVRQIRAALQGQTVRDGAHHPKTADARNNLGLALQLLGRHADAEVEHRAALQSLRERLGPRHIRVGQVQAALAGALAGLGRNEDAALEYRTALSILEPELGVGHPEVASIHNDLATLLMADDRPAEAQAELQTALTAFEAVLPEHHPTLVTVLTNLGRARAAANDPAGALVALERAVTMLDHTQCPPATRAEARHALATLLRDHGDSERARRLAALAVQDYRTLPAARLHDEIAEIEAWAEPRAATAPGPGERASP